MPRIFGSIFTNAPNLKRLSIHGIMLDGLGKDFEFLAESIRSRKLKSLTLRNSPVTDLSAFKIIFGALPFSTIENLELSQTDILFSRESVNDLIKVLPTMNSLKTFYLAGLHNTKIFKELVIALERLNITSLGLSSAQLDDNSAFLLAKMIPKSKLKRLDIRFNRLSQKGVIALENAVSDRPEFQLLANFQEKLNRKRNRVEDQHFFL